LSRTRPVLAKAVRTVYLRNAVIFQYNSVGGRAASHPKHHCGSQQTLCLVPSLGCPTLEVLSRCCAPSDREPPDISRHAICLARASKPDSKPKKKRRKSKKAKEPVIAAPALDAAPPVAAGVAPRLVNPPQHRMHIDYAHSITLGRNKEQYYLMIVIDSIDFTWAQSSRNRSEPEDLIL